jgi:hypothetical protein
MFVGLEFAPNTGNHPLFEGGVGLRGLMGFFEEIVHKLGFLVSRLGGGIVGEAGIKLRTFLWRQFTVQCGGDLVVEWIVGRGRFHRRLPGRDGSALPSILFEEREGTRVPTLEVIFTNSPFATPACGARFPTPDPECRAANHC